MDPGSSSSSSSSKRAEDVEGGAKDHDTICRTSTAVQWQQQQKPELHHRANPHLAHIHVLASSDSYDSLTQQSQSGSIDCAVSVEVICPGTRETEVKSEAEPQEPPLPPPPPPPSLKRSSRLRCCGITLLVLGLLATGVLVPIAVTVGFKQDIPPVYRILQQPQRSHRLVFAFESSALAASAADVLPPHLASQVSSWSALQSSGIHVAAFSDVLALQQALAHLASIGNTSPPRSLLESGNSSSSSAWGLKYALSDFRLVADRQVSQVVDPMQLFDMAREQTRTLLQQQQQQQRGVAAQAGAAEEDEDVYLSRLEQDAWQQQQQQRRQRHRTAAAEVAANGPVEPLTAAGHTGEAQQQEQQQTRRRWRQLAGHDTFRPLEPGLGGSSAAAPSAGSSSSWGSALRRTLLQAAAKAMPARARPQLQLQQRQAQQQVQRGGSRVAWHLTNAGLGVREAWNITSGLDRVVVAVIDSGVELSSGAVGASLWTNAAEVAADGVDNDGNGYADDAMGWDFGGACADVICSFCAPGPDPTDSVGWGTHAAAAIAAQPEVASGTAGIAPGVRVMPLKVADCRHGTQLWDVTTQQGGLVKRLDPDDSSSSSSDAQQQQASRQEVGPTLLGSAAVQALDYALLNGAHIVLAGWSAGQLVDSSSAPNCFMATGAAAGDAAGCVAAVQRALFLDALKPLQEAGVLVVTMQDSASASGTAEATGAGASAPLPCSLSCDLDNVVCVAASTVVLPPNGTRSGLADVMSAAEFFAPLAGPQSSNFFGLVGSTAGEEDRGDGSSRGDGDLHSDAAGPGSSIRLAALSCDAARSSSGAWAQLRSPGTDILAGWAWGSHAVLSGSSAAASVTAGVAALAWSRLGQTLGADASPGAFEGLGQQVKQELLQGSSISMRSSSSSGPSNSSDVSTDTIAVGSSDKRSFIKGKSSSAGSAAPDAAAGTTTLELDLLGALQQGSRAPEVVTLQPAVLDPSVTCAARSLRYTWHIQRDGEGPYDTNAMWYVSRKAVKPPSAFPINRWEFTGATAMVELTGYLDVQVPGTYVLAASSEDRFVLWLQDWWLHMQEAEWGYATWTVRANFTAPGLYKLRLIVYSPSKTFNLQWLPPGASSFSLINSFMSLGQSQPLPQQLLHSMLLPLAARADSSRGKQPGPVSGGDSATDQQQVYVASASTSEAAPAGPAPLPESPGGDSAAAHAGAAAAAGPAEGAPTTAGSSSSTRSMQPAGWDAQGDASSMSATMEPTESAESSQSNQEPMFADDAASDSIGALGSGLATGGTGAASSYAPGSSGYQLQPAYFTPFLGSAGDATAASSGGGDLWSSLRNMFGGSWFGRRRRMSHRRSLLSTGGSSSSRQNVTTSISASIRSHAARQLDIEQTQQQLQQQERRRLAAATTADQYSGQDLAGGSAGGSGGGSVWGRFSAGVGFADRTQFRTLMPDQTKLSFSHSGILSGPGLFVDGWLQFQETVLGWSDPHDNRGAYGMIQGWLDWRDLNPQSAPALAAAAAAAAPARAAGGGSTARQRIAVEGSGLGASVGSMSTGAAGVQFELSCDSCSLQIDGLTVAGSLGGAETSSCVTPAAVAPPSDAGTGSSSQSLQQQSPLLHLSILFTTNDNRKARFQVRSRPCTGINSQAGSGGWLPLTAAGAGSPPAFAVTSAAVAGQAGSPQVFTRGMMCAVTAQLPPPTAPAAASAAAAAAAAAAGNATVTAAPAAGSRVLQQLVFLSAEQMRAAITIRVNATADGPAVPSLAAFNGSVGQAGNASSSNSITNSTSSVTGSRARNAAHSITVDVPQGMFAKDDSDSEGAAPGSDSSSNTTMTEEEAAEAAAEEAALQAELQRRAAQIAAAKAAALAEGISVAELVPDWVSSLPADTIYSFSCGCYWNGSWDGNMSVSVSAAAPGGGGSSGSSGGRAKLFVAGWPVAAKAGRVLGPSDLDVRGYSTLLQRQQLAAGSDSADPLVDAAHVWASAGSFLDASSSSSSSGQVGGDETGGRSTSSSSSSAASSGREALSAEAIRRRRYTRVQQAAAGRVSSGSSGGSGSSTLVGLQPIGRLDGTSRRRIFKRSGQHQLLVLLAEGLTAGDQVIVFAPGDTSSVRSSSADGMLAAGAGSGGGSKASNGSVAVLSSWLPGPWDAWVPAG